MPIHEIPYTLWNTTYILWPNLQGNRYIWTMDGSITEGLQIAAVYRPLKAANWHFIYRCSLEVSTNFHFYAQRSSTMGNLQRVLNVKAAILHWTCPESTVELGKWSHQLHSKCGRKTNSSLESHLFLTTSGKRGWLEGQTPVHCRSTSQDNKLQTRPPKQSNATHWIQLTQCIWTLWYPWWWQKSNYGH